MVIKRISFKVSILFKTDTLAKRLALHNAHLVKSNHSYVEVFSGSRPLRHNEVQLYIISFSCTHQRVKLDTGRFVVNYLYPCLAIGRVRKLLVMFTGHSIYRLLVEYGNICTSSGAE